MRKWTISSALVDYQELKPVEFRRLWPEFRLVRVKRYLGELLIESIGMDQLKEYQKRVLVDLNEPAKLVHQDVRIIIRLLDRYRAGGFKPAEVSLLFFRYGRLQEIFIRS